MRATYRVLGYLIAIEVVIQAAAIAYANFGVSKFVEGGGTIDKALVESDELAFDEIVGFIVHGINGMNVIPLLAIIMLIVSFFAKVEKGVVMALLVVVVTALQVFLEHFPPHRVLGGGGGGGWFDAASPSQRLADTSGDAQAEDFEQQQAAGDDGQHLGGDVVERQRVTERAQEQHGGRSRRADSRDRRRSRPRPGARRRRRRARGRVPLSARAEAKRKA